MRTLTEEDIRTRAYKLWKAAGERNTKMDAFWYQAEKELLAEQGASGGLESEGQSPSAESMNRNVERTFDSTRKIRIGGSGS